MYLSDIFDLGIDDFNKALADRLFTHALTPVLLGGLENGRISTKPALVSKKVRLFLIRHVLENIHCRTLIEPLAAALLHESLSPSSARLVFGPVSPVGLHPLGSGKVAAVYNHLRTGFLEQFESRDDKELLFAAAVVSTCLRNRHLLPAGFLEAGRVVPPRPMSAADFRPGINEKMGWFFKLVLHPLGACKPNREVDCMVTTDDIHAERCEPERQPSPDQAGVLLLLLDALPKQHDWDLDTIRFIPSILLAWFADPGVCCNTQCQAAATESLHVALRAAARLAVEVLEQGRPESEVLDIVFEEWQLQSEQASDLQRFFGDPSCLLRAYDIDGSTRKAIRSFFFLRRLLIDLVEQSSSVGPDGFPREGRPWVLHEQSPLATKEAISPEALREGSAFELDSTERLMCSISAPDGKSTRYLVLHDFWLLLAQPDLSTPGWAVVETIWPLWQVQSCVDRSEPRTLQVSLRGKSCGPQIGMAFHGVRLGQAGDDRRNAFYSFAIDFDDVPRCQAAELHFHSRRTEVRGRLLRQAIDFAERCCTDPLPAFR